MKKVISALVIIICSIYISSCSKDNNPVGPAPLLQIGQPITSEELKGALNGTLLSGKKYYFKTDITINSGDTLLLQPGSKVIAMGDGLTPDSSPQIKVNGVFLSLGTEDQPVSIEVPIEKKLRSGLWSGSWGGIQFDVNSPLCVIKWTHIEGAGGPAGSNPPYGMSQGDPRCIINYANSNGNFILEDSWIKASKGDAVRISGGKIAVFRNTFEMCGTTSGNDLNINSGTVGDIAYNIFIGCATNGVNISNSGNMSIQTNIFVYNNTFLDCGMREIETGRGGAFNIENGARGKFYNNIIFNCRFGNRITADADTINFSYGNTLYFGSTQTIVDGFLAATQNSIAKFQSNDLIYETTPQNYFQLFYGFAGAGYNISSWTFPVSTSTQPDFFIMQFSSDFRLRPNISGLDKGKTDFQPMNPVTVTNSLFKPTVLNPGKDMGACQSDGTGNQH